MIEAKQMGVKHIKWNIGDYNGELYLNELKALLDRGIAISIEMIKPKHLEQSLQLTLI